MMENLLEAIGGFNRLMIYFGGAVAALFVCWSGFQWMMAQGDAQKQAQARSGVIGVIIGLVIMGTSFIIPGIVSEGVVEPAGGQALVQTKVGLSCDALLKRLIIATPTATNRDRIKRLIGQVQAVNGDACGSELWTPEPVQTVIANHQNTCRDVALDNDDVLLGIVRIPPELRQAGGNSALIKHRTHRGSDGNILIYWDSTPPSRDKLPSDGAHCWVYLAAEKVWKSVG